MNISFTVNALRAMYVSRLFCTFAFLALGFYFLKIWDSRILLLPLRIGKLSVCCCCRDWCGLMGQEREGFSDESFGFSNVSITFAIASFLSVSEAVPLGGTNPNQSRAFSLSTYKSRLPPASSRSFPIRVLRTYSRPVPDVRWRLLPTVSPP